MSARREVEMMTCAYCGQEKAWRDGFPSHSYAECWDCAWKEHQRYAHPVKRKPWWRRLHLEPVPAPDGSILETNHQATAPDAGAVRSEAS